MLPEGSSPIDVLIPKDDNLCDSKSEHTTCNYLMGRFLEDSAKDQQDDYLESVSVVNAETERVELSTENLKLLLNLHKRLKLSFTIYRKERLTIITQF